MTSYKMNEEPKFASSQQEVEYLRTLANDYKKSYEAAKDELDEFQQSSRELELELEAQLVLAENKVKELTSANQRLHMENDILKEKLERLQSTTHRQLSEVQDELAQVRAYKDELQKYIRELEQNNDDLERTQRATVVSLEDFESRLNQAIERNAFLESELEERGSMAVTVQRLKDEARDLRQELAVRRKRSDSTDDGNDLIKSPAEKLKREAFFATASPLSVTTTADATQPSVDSQMQPPPPFVTPAKTSTSVHGPLHQGTPLTPSARITALNIVGDLLRKVAALESKLASCRRNVTREQTSRLNRSSASPLNYPRAKHTNHVVGEHGGDAGLAASPTILKTDA